MASGMPALEIDFSWSCIKPPGSERSVGETTLPLHTLHFVAAKFAEEHGQRIVKLVHHALLEWNDGVVGDANLLRANFGAALRDVAKADPKLILEQAGAVAAVERMHFKPGNAHKKARPGELLLLVVFAKNVAYVLTQKTFDALAELLHAVHVELRDFPFNSRARFERGDFPVDTVIPRNVGDKVFDARKGFHRKDGDGLVHREIVHAGLAGQAGTAVNFRGARAALPCFAIPADGEVRGEMALDVVESVENDHAGSDGHAVVHRLPALRISAKNPQGGFFHHGSPFCERRIASSHRRGRAEPKTFHLVKFVGPM